MEADSFGPDHLRIGVVTYETRGGTDALMGDFAARLKSDGADVGGLLQHGRMDENGHWRMVLTDLRTGRLHPISQDLGAGSATCSLDTSALVEASQVLRREIAARPDLLIVNKFAGLEAEGRGLVAELFAAIEAEIPILTTLAVRHRPAWDRIMGGAGDMLDPTEAALWDWWRRTRKRGDA